MHNRYTVSIPAGVDAVPVPYALLAAALHVEQTYQDVQATQTNRRFEIRPGDAITIWFVPPRDADNIPY